MTILWEGVSTQSLVRAVSRNIGISALPCLLAEDALAQGLWRRFLSMPLRSTEAFPLSIIRINI